MNISCAETDDARISSGDSRVAPEAPEAPQQVSREKSGVDSEPGVSGEAAEATDHGEVVEGGDPRRANCGGPTVWVYDFPNCHHASFLRNLAASWCAGEGRSVICEDLYHDQCGATGGWARIVFNCAAF